MKIIKPQIQKRPIQDEALIFKTAFTLIVLAYAQLTDH